jgi:hypothetical protein
MKRSILLQWVVNAALIAFLGPVFKFKDCGFNSMIFEKQACVTMCISDMLIPFGALAYAWSVIAYFLYFYDSSKKLYILLSLLISLGSMAAYTYFLTVQVDITCFALGYYFTFISLGLTVLFMVVYKLNIRRMLV